MAHTDQTREQMLVRKTLRSHPDAAKGEAFIAQLFKYDGDVYKAFTAMRDENSPAYHPGFFIHPEDAGWYISYLQRCRPQWADALRTYLSGSSPPVVMAAIDASTVHHGGRLGAPMPDRTRS